MKSVQACTKYLSIENHCFGKLYCSKSHVCQCKQQERNASGAQQDDAYTNDGGRYHVNQDLGKRKFTLLSFFEENIDSSSKSIRANVFIRLSTCCCVFTTYKQTYKRVGIACADICVDLMWFHVMYAEVNAFLNASEFMRNNCL